MNVLGRCVSAGQAKGFGLVADSLKKKLRGYQRP